MCVGKTWHTWQVDLGHQLPLGPPQLMMTFISDGQIDPSVVESRDKDVGCNAAEVAASRRELKPEEGVPSHEAGPVLAHGQGGAVRDAGGRVQAGPKDVIHEQSMRQGVQI